MQRSAWMVWMAAVVVAGCGGDSSGDAGTDADADADSSAEAEAAAADADVDADSSAEAEAAADADGGTCALASPDLCASPGASWVFCSGFEEGNLDLWDDYDGNPPETNQLLEDPGPCGTAGNHVMRLRVPAGRGGADLVKVLPATYDRVYARWYQQWEPGYDFAARNHGSGLFGGSRDLLGRSDIRPDGTDMFISLLEPVETPYGYLLNAYTYYRGMYMDCVDPAGSCWGDHFPCMFDEGTPYCERPQHRETVVPAPLVAGRWYCLELLIDAGTPVAAETDADGVLDFWVDGLELGPWTDLWWRTVPDLRASILWLSLFHHAEHSVEGILLDDVVVSTDRIGCLPP
jgi:hypothetical protein